MTDVVTLSSQQVHTAHYLCGHACIYYAFLMFRLCRWRWLLHLGFWSRQQSTIYSFTRKCMQPLIICYTYTCNMLYIYLFTLVVRCTYACSLLSCAIHILCYTCCTLHIYM